MKRILTVVVIVLVASLMAAPVALACGFLVSANGAVRLGTTTTFVVWEDGIEHYITNFTFEGPAESFGSLIPLPAEPTDVTRAGDWTLQRLQREVSPVGLARLTAATEGAADSVEVLLRTRIDSLDVVVLKGGGADVLAWVNENGFSLPPGPETDHMLEFYASRSPFFMAARFDADAAAQDDFVAGDGIPVQITMPTRRPWVPLHILHGATPDSEIIVADVFLLTPERPDLLYGEGLTIERSEWASDLLLDDLRSDEGMEWIPTQGWFTYLKLETEAANVVYDLSVGVGSTPPSFRRCWIHDSRADSAASRSGRIAVDRRCRRDPRLELTTDQIEALGFTQATPWWRDGVMAALVAVIAGAVGGGLILVVSRTRIRSPRPRNNRASPPPYDAARQRPREDLRTRPGYPCRYLCTDQSDMTKPA